MAPCTQARGKFDVVDRRVVGRGGLAGRGSLLPGRVRGQRDIRNLLGRSSGEAPLGLAVRVIGLSPQFAGVRVSPGRDRATVADARHSRRHIGIGAVGDLYDVFVGARCVESANLRVKTLSTIKAVAMPVAVGGDDQLGGLAGGRLGRRCAMGRRRRLVSCQAVGIDGNAVVLVAGEEWIGGTAVEGNLAGLPCPGRPCRVHLGLGRRPCRQA